MINVQYHYHNNWPHIKIGRLGAQRALYNIIIYLVLFSVRLPKCGASERRSEVRHGDNITATSECDTDSVLILLVAVSLRIKNRTA